MNSNTNFQSSSTLISINNKSVWRSLVAGSGVFFFVIYTLKYSNQEPLITTTTPVRAVSRNLNTLPHKDNLKKKSTTKEEIPSSPQCGNFLGDDNVYCLPKFIIGGAMKCGTNEAGHLISLHPRVKFNLCPEEIRHDHDLCTPAFYQGLYDPEKDDLHLWESQASWLKKGRIHEYFHRFPITDGVNTVNIDKTPEYISTYKHDYRDIITQYMPGVKMVFSVCDPAERFVSEYFHHHKPHLLPDFEKQFTRYDLEPPQNITEFVDYLFDMNNTQKCMGLEEFCDESRIKYLPKGKYIHGIQDWLDALPSPDDLLILDMNAPADENARRLVEFAELPMEEYPIEKTMEKIAFTNDKVSTYTGRGASWEKYPEVMSKLASYYAESNKELAYFLGVDFPLEWRSTKEGSS